jgi:PAS domain S-box-containing protein
MRTASEPMEATELALLSSQRASWSFSFDRRPITICLLVFAGYYLGARIGFALTFQPHPVSVLWPPNSILLAALLLTPLRLWWLVLIAAFPAHCAAQWQSNVPPSMILCWFISNCFEALIGASLTRYFIRGPLRFVSLRNVGIFCLCAVVFGPFVSSFLDAAFVRWNHWGVDTYWQLWGVRFSSNVLAALTVTPLVVTWATGGLAAVWNASRKRHLEGGFLFLGLVLVSSATFYKLGPESDSSLLLLPLPFLLWAAVRFGARGTSTAIWIVALSAIWSAAHGHGPFSEGSPGQMARSVQMFLIVLSLPTMFLAAVIEERATVAETLRERDALNRGIIDSLTSLVTIVDRSGRIIATNDAWRKSYESGGVPTLGIDVGANYLDVCRSGAHAGDHSVTEVLAGIEGVLSGKETEFQNEYPCVTPAGALWFEILVLPLRSEAGGAVISHRDITSRRAAEKALRERDERISLAAESANLALWTIDFERHESWMSDHGRAIFGLAPNERLTRELFLARVHPEDRETVENAIEEARAASESFEIEYRLLRPDGETRWLNARGRYLRNARGEVAELIGVAIDVTVQMKANLELRLQRLEMARMSRVALMGELTASLAHELNQPLTAIASNAAAGRRFLRQGSVEPGMLEELLEDVAIDARRAGDVIHGIHHFVRKSEGERRAVDMNETIWEVLRLLHSDLLGRAASIETRLALNLPSLKADPVQLQQILLNLIMNALEAMQTTPMAERRIVVSTECSGDSVITGVRDFGRGLPGDDPDKIFTHFYSTKPGGMGMGLAIIRSIVEAHGGNLSAANAEPGAQFFFALPVIRKCEVVQSA